MLLVTVYIVQCTDSEMNELRVADFCIGMGRWISVQGKCDLNLLRITDGLMVLHNVVC